MGHILVSFTFEISERKWLSTNTFDCCFVVGTRNVTNCNYSCGNNHRFSWYSNNSLHNSIRGYQGVPSTGSRSFSSISKDNNNLYSNLFILRLKDGKLYVGFGKKPALPRKQRSNPAVSVEFQMRVPTSCAQKSKYLLTACLVRYCGRGNVVGPPIAKSYSIVDQGTRFLGHHIAFCNPLGFIFNSVRTWLQGTWSSKELNQTKK